MKKILTLCIVHEGERVLLGLKKRGFGAGKWNGFGGKVKAGESVEEAARREMHEEAGVEVGALEEVGALNFSFEGNSDVLEVHIFKSKEVKGEPVETEEMRPQWFPVSVIPFQEMWADDIFWFPMFLAGKKFKGTFHFDTSDKILLKELREIDTI